MIILCIVKLKECLLCETKSATIDSWLMLNHNFVNKINLFDNENCIKEMFRGFFQGVYRKSHRDNNYGFNHLKTNPHINCRKLIITEALLLSFTSKLKNANSYLPD